MGAVTEHLLAQNAALTELVLEAVGNGCLGDDYTARAIGHFRGADAAEDFRACRGEWAQRQSERFPQRRARGNRARSPSG